MLRPLLAALAAALLLAPVTASGSATPSGAARVARIPDDAAPRAYVLLIHGGAWYRVGPRATARMDPVAARLRAAGFGTVNVDYRAEAAAFGDVLAAYRRLRGQVGPRAPICAYGTSAGGQLALMLAVRRPDVACVVAYSAPSLLDRLPPRLRAHARAAFPGPGGLAAWSPARYRLGIPLLLAQARRDPIVPVAESHAMRAAAPDARLVLLDPGPAPWVHTSVDAGQLAALDRREVGFLRRSTARWRPAVAGHDRRVTG